MAGQTNRNKNCCFWDRLISLKRIQSNGSLISKGGEEPGYTKVGIFKGEGNDRSYLVAHLSSMLVLNANVEVWPTSISESGESVTMWLTDFSGDRNNPCRRKYILKFFEEAAAMNFFQIYCNALPKGQQGPDFASLRDGVPTPPDGKKKAAAVEDEEDYDDFMSSDDDSLLLDGRQQMKKSVEYNDVSPSTSKNSSGNDGENGDGQVGGECQENYQQQEEDHDGQDYPDELPLDLIELSDYGESQDLYNPLRPFGNNRY
jgi:hypothetical protein